MSYPKAIAIATAVPAGSPALTVAQEVFVPSVVKYLPEFVDWLGASALNAVFAVVCPVPPFAIATVPVTFAAVPVVFWLSVGTSAATIAVNEVAVPFERK
jgi:hypothetical protein